ncbi:DUF3305 domain-containing protein [Caenispirillum salinarum]|uniref:DUF3305 domain-containing protein n=1 Tax=Caenispirillum salinarum TaxID=859058 RepID=UPI00384BCF4C
MTAERFPVAVVAERRPCRSPWLDHVARVDAVLPAAVDCAPWTPLGEEAGAMRFFAGNTDIVARKADTKNYKDNLEAPQPAVYVVLRKGATPLGWSLLLATADPAEAQAHGECGDDLLEAVAMPPEVRDWLTDFVTRHHVERKQWKRRRDRVDPEAMAPRHPDSERGITT